MLSFLQDMLLPPHCCDKKTLADIYRKVALYEITVVNFAVHLYMYVCVCACCVYAYVQFNCNNSSRENIKFLTVKALHLNSV